MKPNFISSILCAALLLTGSISPIAAQGTENADEFSMVESDSFTEKAELFEETSFEEESKADDGDSSAEAWDFTEEAVENDDKSFVESDEEGGSVNAEIQESAIYTPKASSLPAAPVSFVGSFNSQNDTKIYSFRLNAAGKVNIQFKHNYIDDDSEFWTIELFNSDGNKLNSFTSRGNKPNTHPLSSGLPVGEYFVKVSPRYSFKYSNVPFTVDIQFQKSDAWESEVNNTSQTADSITFGKKYFGSLWNSSDEDWYKVKAGSAGYITLDFIHEYFDDSWYFWTVEFYDSSFNMLYSQNMKGYNAEVSTPKIGITVGDIYLRVRQYSYDHANVDYSFKLNFTKSSTWESEDNGDISKADPIALNTTYNGSLKYSDDKDWFVFTSAAKGEYYFDFTRVSGNLKAEFKVTVFDNNTNEVINKVIKTGEKNPTRLALSLNASRKYYVRIENYYNAGECEYKFAISNLTKVSLTQASVSGINAQYNYTGKALTPKPVVIVNGKTLAEGKDYTLAYSNNVNAGTATIKITGIGNYSGTRSVTFKIVKVQTGSGSSGSGSGSVVVKVTMYRLYNINSGEHFYTANAEEKNTLVKIGWKFEGKGWTAPSKSNTPVYRLYNPNAGDHHYTSSAAERDHLKKVGWKYEGIGWYSDDSKSIPLYRQYNPNAKAGSHNYTTDKGENDGLVRLGWKAEGIGWYGMK